MVRRESYTKYEHQVLPGFRQNLNAAESTEDVRKFFTYAIKELLGGIFGEKVDVRQEDIALRPEQEPPFSLGTGLQSHPEFRSVWKDSDLPQVIGRFAESAARRYRYLRKNPRKTEAKIRM